MAVLLEALGRLKVLLIGREGGDGRLPTDNADDLARRIVDMAGYILAKLAVPKGIAGELACHARGDARGDLQGAGTGDGHGFPNICLT